jgi:ATP-dependent helicase HrpB
MDRLATLPVSRDAAEQRRGRAGRTAPGVCYRLWPETHNHQLRPRRRPEILDADLATLALELRLWGATAPDQLDWLDPPPPGAWRQAVALLGRLGAVEADFRLTERGRRMAGLGMHPRLGRMVMAGLESGCGPLALALAALLEERDILRTRPDGRDADLTTRVEILQATARIPVPDSRVNATACRRVLRTVARWRRRLGLSSEVNSAAPTGRLLACAYPDRIGRRRKGPGARYRLSGGRGARLDESDPLAAHEFIVAAHLDGAGPEARIFLAAPIRRSEISALYGAEICRKETVGWDRRNRKVISRVQTRLDRLVLTEKPLLHPPVAEVSAALLTGIKELGIQALPWDDRSLNLQARIGLLEKIGAPQGPWPKVSDPDLEGTMDVWLRPWIEGMGRIEHLNRLDICKILKNLLTHRQTAALRRLAPRRYEVPSGSRITIDYTAGETPVLAVRLQEMFGLLDTPAVAGGRVPLLLHLLSPAMRPVQVTRDLASFWKHGYPQVRKELRGRYPRHHWPQDPLGAVAIRGVRPRRPR